MAERLETARRATPPHWREGRKAGHFAEVPGTEASIRRIRTSVHYNSCQAKLGLAMGVHILITLLIILATIQEQLER